MRHKQYCQVDGPQIGTINRKWWLACRSFGKWNG